MKIHQLALILLGMVIEGLFLAGCSEWGRIPETKYSPPATQTAPSALDATLTSSPIMQKVATPTFETHIAETATAEKQPVITRSNVRYVAMLGNPISFIGGLGTLGKQAAIIVKPMETWLARIESPGEITIRNLGGGLINKLENPSDHIELLVPSRDGRYLAAADARQGEIAVWDLNSFQIKTRMQFRGYQEHWYGLNLLSGDFSSDSQYLAISGCRVAGSDRLCMSSGINVYDVETGVLITSIRGLQRETMSIKFFNHGKELAIAGEGESTIDADLLIWDIENNKRKATASVGREDFLITIEFDREEKFPMSSAAISREQVLLTWDPLKWSYQVCHGSEKYGPSVIAFSKDNQMAITDGADSSIEFWGVGSCELVYTLKAEAGTFYSIDVSADGTRIITLGSLDGLRIWGVPPAN